MLGTILVSVVVLAVVGAIVYSMVRDKRKGKSIQCGGDCRHCGGCH